MQESEKLKQKYIKDQVIVVTGASGQIGKATVRMAASAGARVVMASGDEAALQELADELARKDGDAMYVIADVSREEDVVRISRSAIRTYGAFNTWISATETSVSGTCLDAPLEDMRRIIETHFWGVVNGSRTAIRHFTQTGQGGAIIHVAPASLGKVQVTHPIHGIASQAGSGWLDALRIEADHLEIPVSISLVYPGPDNAFRQRRGTKRRNAKEAVIPSAEEVAAAVLQCAVSPKGQVYVSSNARHTPVLQGISTRLAEGFMSAHETASPAVVGEMISQEIMPGTAHRQAEVAAKKKTTQRASPRTLFSSILLAGLGAGMWLLSRPKKRVDNNSEDPKKNG